MKFARKFGAKFVLWLVVAGVFAGCASGGRLGVASNEVAWMPYIENNGTRELISFSNLAEFSEQNSTRPVVGVANIKTNLGMQKIGYMRSLAHKTSNIVLNLDSVSQIDVSSQAGKEQLETAHALKFYEFKQGRIETIVYRSQKPLCVAFLGGEMIQTRSVTNYYLRDNSGFFTSVLETDMLAFKGANITHRSFVYEISDPQELENVRKFTASKEVENLINSDIKKQGRLLYILCSTK